MPDYDMPNNDSTSYDLNPALVDLLRAHGYASTMQDDWVVPTGFQTAVRLQATAWPVQHDTCVVSRLDVGVALPDGRELYECFGDVGQDVDEALHNNLHSFCQGVWHVLLDAFSPHNRHHGGHDDADGGTHQEPLHTAQDMVFTAYIGSMVLKGVGVSAKQILPASWLDRLLEHIRQQSLSAEWHFMRFFYSRWPGQSPTCECMIDNRNIEAMEDAMQTYAWPELDDYYSVRLFILLRPENA